MEIIDYFTSSRRDHWLSQIGYSDWDAGQYLYELLRDDKLKKLCGESTKVLLLTDGDDLVAYCTYAEQDDVRAPELTPWIGFVYTFPKYRGKRIMSQLLEFCRALAEADGHEFTYISTGWTGLYEKYGYDFLTTKKDVKGADSRIYRKSVRLPV